MALDISSIHCNTGLLVNRTLECFNVFNNVLNSLLSEKIFLPQSVLLQSFSTRGCPVRSYFSSFAPHKF